MTQSNRQYPLRPAVTDMPDNQPQLDNGRQPLGNSEPETCGAGEPSSPNSCLTGSRSAPVNTLCAIRLQGLIHTS